MIAKDGAQARKGPQPFEDLVGIWSISDQITKAPRRIDRACIRKDGLESCVVRMDI
jgi:hypothetical protein